MVGDGRSDFCIAERCQLVIAKGSLLRRCREQRLPHVPMLNFGDACRGFSRWLARQDVIPDRSFVREPDLARASI